tara:strand:- start:123 stop:341 length:219 start_codon:yes stop_codon:yes gene_type:complete
MFFIIGIITFSNNFNLSNNSFKKLNIVLISVFTILYALLEMYDPNRTPEIEEIIMEQEMQEYVPESTGDEYY